MFASKLRFVWLLSLVLLVAGCANRTAILPQTTSLKPNHGVVWLAQDLVCVQQGLALHSDCPVYGFVQLEPTAETKAKRILLSFNAPLQQHPAGKYKITELNFQMGVAEFGTRALGMAEFWPELAGMEVEIKPGSILALGHVTARGSNTRTGFVDVPKTYGVVWRTRMTSEEKASLQAYPLLQNLPLEELPLEKTFSKIPYPELYEKVGGARP